MHAIVVSPRINHVTKAVLLAASVLGIASLACSSTMDAGSSLNQGAASGAGGASSTPSAGMAGAASAVSASGASGASNGANVGGSSAIGTGGIGIGTGGIGTGGIGTGGSPGSNTCEPPTPGTNPNRVCIRGKPYYLNGINVAWDQWTGDLMNYNAAAFETMFADLESIGANSVRWWWFIDGNNQLSFDGQLVRPLSPAIFQNLDRAFDAAAEHGILIMPSLLSFDIKNQNRQFLVTNAAATDAFVTNVVAPLAARYSDHPAMGIWEIMNEGDWLLSSEGGSVSVADYQRFNGKVAAAIHAAAPGALVTTGAASFKYMMAGNNIHSDSALIAATGGDPLATLDVYQTHYYSWMHGAGWSYEPWIKSSTEWLPEGKPILIGEFACKGEAGRWSIMDMHVVAVDQGFAGTYCWAYFNNRADNEGYFPDARPGMEAIAQRIPGAMVGE